ncbi:hypothetical protein QTP88_010827 [Uroleucon formosanum]
MSQKQWLTEFIEIYKNETCLWQNKKKLKEVDPKAIIDTVKSKINTIRCTFKKEFGKVKALQKSGSGVDKIYIPKLWYYDSLQFLKNQEIPRESRSNISGDDEETNDSRPGSSLTGDCNLSQIGSDEPNAATSSSLTTAQRSRPIKINSNALDPNLTNEVLLSVNDHFKRPI